MTRDRFDFRAASLLVQSVSAAADNIDVKNGQIENKFGNLREWFKDGGYDEYVLDMNIANKAINDVITQMRTVGKHIAEYAEKIKDI